VASEILSCGVRCGRPVRLPRPDQPGSVGPSFVAQRPAIVRPVCRFVKRLNHNILRLCFRSARNIVVLLYSHPSRRRGLLGALGSMVYTDETCLSEVSSLHHGRLLMKPAVLRFVLAAGSGRSLDRASAQTATPAPATGP
jgi:hypothetical protein